MVFSQLILPYMEQFKKKTISNLIMSIKIIKSKLTTSSNPKLTILNKNKKVD